jgi:hypothetical protein
MALLTHYRAAIHGNGGAGDKISCALAGLLGLLRLTRSCFGDSNCAAVHVLQMCGELFSQQSTKFDKFPVIRK